jgi:predicted transposase YdaD
MGLRYPDELVNQLLEGIGTMRESTTYQAILREGRSEGRIAGEQRMLLRLGTKRFGLPDAATVADIEAIQDVDRLESLGERILEPNLRGWDDLLRGSSS